MGKKGLIRENWANAPTWKTPARIGRQNFPPINYYSSQAFIARLAAAAAATLPLPRLRPPASLVSLFVAIPPGRRG